MHLLIKQTINLEIEKAYVTLKDSLARKGCKIVSEEPPNHILAKQGSLWGLSPFTAKKTIGVTLEHSNDETQVTCSSRLSSDWRNITIIGCVLAGVLVGVCLWMTVDLHAFEVAGKANSWSWLVTVNGALDALAAQSLIRLTETLAAFLSLVIVLETVITIYVYRRIDQFAKEALDTLTASEAVNGRRQ